MLPHIIQFDRRLFEYINSNFHTQTLDWLLPLLRNSATWVPLYIFLLSFILLNFNKNKWYWIIFAILTVVLSNYISSNLIKQNVFRLRPCNDPYFKDKINFLIGYRPQSSSFTSSHATNHFAMAAFFYITLKKYIGNIAWLFYGWAAIICFAQVYVGVHYLLDVACGGIIGFIFGYLCATSFNKRFFLRN